MTMFTLPNFCRVCLKYDKNLIDLAHIENEPSETLISKLQLCVSEVEWTVFKPLLCHPCIKRLNIAYSFKKQCVQSSGVLKNYVELVKESQKKTESQNSIKTENIIPTTGGAYMLLPNQKYVKILVGGAQNQPANTFQNVFLNLIPTTTINSVGTPTDSSKASANKDTNQNVFLNLNNTFQKYIPVSQSFEGINDPKQKHSPKKADLKAANVNVNKLLTETKTEELSVEIDPTIFGLEEEGDSNGEEANDYDEVISPAKITVKGFKPNGEKIQNGKEDQKQFVPILPKTQEDFFSSGQHFLFSSSESSETFACERCQKSFTTKKLLRAHINQFHLGKLPFKCEYCYSEFHTRVEYDFCIKSHLTETDSANNPLTLQDFANTQNLNDSEVEANNITPSEDGEYVCDVCCRPFHSSTGLLRHKVRKHNQKTKKKYFIKGMKNARCDICNREFSTQSYMQHHKKLHMRDDIGYKYKVFGKSKYGDIDKEENEKDKAEKTKVDAEMDGSLVETLDVTPDIFTEDDGRKSGDDRKSDDDSNEGESRVDDVSSNHDSSKMEVDEETASDNEVHSEDNSDDGINSNPENSNKNDDQDTNEDV